MAFSPRLGVLSGFVFNAVHRGTLPLASPGTLYGSLRLARITTIGLQLETESVLQDDKNTVCMFCVCFQCACHWVLIGVVLRGLLHVNDGVLRVDMITW
jgi:hypothetical protein